MTPERKEEKSTLDHTSTVKALFELIDITDDELSINADFIRQTIRSAYVHLKASGSKREKLRKKLNEAQKTIAELREGNL